MIYTAAVALTLAATASATLYTDVATHQKAMWEEFKNSHQKNYATMDEEKTRFGYFLENLKMADLRNANERKNGGTAVHGITRFSDLSQAEFESRYLTADKRMKSSREGVKVMTDADLPPVKAGTGLVNWSGILTTPVKDQGYCGSCWAFSATEQIESDYMRISNTDYNSNSYILSPEQIVQCDSKAFGCGGGWTESAYGYVKTAGGIEQDSDYPYTSYMGVTGTCSSKSSAMVIALSSFTAVASNEATMATYVQTTGPLSVCLDASSWNSYQTGIMSVCGQNVDHCVQAVGVDTSASTPYWIVRNSWGTSWGENGYIQLLYGQNTCDITNDPTWTTVSKK